MRQRLIAGSLAMTALMSQVTMTTAATQQQIDQVVSVIERLCLSGSQFRLTADISGNIGIKKLLPGIQGGTDINIKSDRGGVGYLNEEIRRLFDGETRSCMQQHIKQVIELFASGPIPFDRTLPGTLAGAWVVKDPRTAMAFTSVEMFENGQLKSQAWGRNFGGPNGLGANTWRFENGLLKFIYIQPGRAREDEMLVGAGKNISPTEFQFTVSGGYYGAANANPAFLFSRP